MKLTMFALALSAFAVAAPASAQVSLENKVLKENVRVSSDGTRSTTLAPAKSIAPGSTAVYVMTYRNNGKTPASNLEIRNAVPRGVRYAGAGQNSQEPLVSVDGGNTFGRLGALSVRGQNGAMRAAQFADVTNVRWTIVGPVAPGASGNVSYRGVLQ